jgi:hypothetical protein
MQFAGLYGELKILVAVQAVTSGYLLNGRHQAVRFPSFGVCPYGELFLNLGG